MLGSAPKEVRFQMLMSAVNRFAPFGAFDNGKCFLDALKGAGGRGAVLGPALRNTVCVVQKRNPCMTGYI